MYVDSSDLNSPVAMETDIPLIEDVQRLKKTVEEGAIQVNLTFSLSLLIFPLRITLCQQICICYQSLKSLPFEANCTVVLTIVTFCFYSCFVF